MVADFQSQPYALTPIGNTLFFTAADTGHGNELWKTDGTTAGTVLVKDINPGPAGSSLSSPANLNGVLVFGVGDPDGIDLFRSDGTEAGTYRIKSDFKDIVSRFIVSSDKAYFIGRDATPEGGEIGGSELWVTDGTRREPGKSPISIPVQMMACPINLAWRFLAIESTSGQPHPNPVQNLGLVTEPLTEPE